MVNINRTDPYRIRISKDNIRKVKQFGTTTYWERDKNNPTDFFMCIRTNDTKPHYPLKESYKETIDKILENLDVRQDHIREHKPHKIFKEDKNAFEYWTEINEKVFSKDNKYDLLIDKMKKKVIMPNKENKILGRVI